MKKGLFLLFALSGLFFQSAINESHSLKMVGGTAEIEILPGETKTFDWKLSASDTPITLKIGARGWGSQFLSYPETLELGPFEAGTIEVTVSIPIDHPGDIVLTPEVTATEYGTFKGQVAVNVEARKLTSINILQNENPEFLTNTAYDEPEKVEDLKTVKSTPKETVEEKKEFEGGSLSISAPSEQQTSESQDEGGGCLIATATYGSEMANQIQILRELRDDKLLSTTSGTAFMSGFNSLYYSFSPTIADLERQSQIFKEAVKLTITPLITSLSLLNYVDMDSESEVLGYGISLILLNIGMYFVAPTIVIAQVRRKFKKTYEISKLN